MTISIAGHIFNSLCPGEHCQREDCHGVGSLVDLTSMVDELEDGDHNVAHVGPLSLTEVNEIRKARNDLRMKIEAAWNM